MISGRLDLHKILLLVGPTRAGKGVISRTLGKLVGDDNVAGPTLSSLSGDFGLAPLLGKSLAVVSDARLNGRGAHVVVERLLSISGEDTLTVNRKYRDQWTGKLPARLMLCSNELPHLGDASMAIAGRFVPLLLNQSFYGKEDLELENKIAGELPGILNWALDGLERLADNGKFTRPPNVDDTIRTLQDLASPVGAFVRDRCVIGSDETVKIDELYRSFRDWAEANGHVKSTKQVFGRDLRAALPGRLKVAQPGAGDNRPRAYEGIGLTPDAAADLPSARPNGASGELFQHACVACANRQKAPCARDARVLDQLNLYSGAGVIPGRHRPPTGTHARELEALLGLEPWSLHAAVARGTRGGMTPRRILLSRRKGFRLADQAPGGETIVIVARPRKWGNPYPVDVHGRDEAIRLYREWLPTSGLDLRELAGCHLACWCPLDRACHADVLLEIANDSGGVP